MRFLVGTNIMDVFKQTSDFNARGYFNRKIYSRETNFTDVKLKYLDLTEI